MIPFLFPQSILVGEPSPKKFLRSILVALSPPKKQVKGHYRGTLARRKQERTMPTSRKGIDGRETRRLQIQAQCNSTLQIDVCCAKSGKEGFRNKPLRHNWLLAFMEVPRFFAQHAHMKIRPAWPAHMASCKSEPGLQNTTCLERHAGMAIAMFHGHCSHFTAKPGFLLYPKHAERHDHFSW